MPPPPKVKPNPYQVRPEDFAQMAVLHHILRVLNDTLAGAPEIAGQVERFPVLKARVQRRFTDRFKRPAPSVREQIALLGNRDFEMLLLELLEDLTVLKAEMDDG